jgi:hypothetical protein
MGPMDGPHPDSTWPSSVLVIREEEWASGNNLCRWRQQGVVKRCLETQQRAPAG